MTKNELPAIKSKVIVRFATVRSEITRQVTVTAHNEDGTFVGIYKIHGLARVSGPITADRVVR